MRGLERCARLGASLQRSLLQEARRATGSAAPAASHLHTPQCGCGRCSVSDGPCSSAAAQAAPAQPSAAFAQHRCISSAAAWGSGSALASARRQSMAATGCSEAGQVEEAPIPATKLLLQVLSGIESPPTFKQLAAEAKAQHPDAFPSNRHATPAARVARAAPIPGRPRPLSHLALPKPTGPSRRRCRT